jgi:hypothetical protein
VLFSLIETASKNANVQACGRAVTWDRTFVAAAAAAAAKTSWQGRVFIAVACVFVFGPVANS